MNSKDPWLAIVNPASGGTRAGDRWPRVRTALARRGIDVDVEFTRAPGAGAAVAEQAVRAGRRRLLAVGGDGSINDVVNGIMRADAGLGDPVTLATAPLGTGNDWARSLGMPRDPEGVARALAAEQTFAHDVGLLEFPAAGGATPVQHWFINIAGAGYDSFVIARLPAHLPSPWAYLRGALTGLAAYRSPRFRITCGSRTLDERLLLVVVANGQYCGNRMRMAPHARLDDGLLEVVAIRDVALLEVLWKIHKLYRGTLSGDRLVWEAQGTRVRIETDTPAAVEADGQVVGQTPVEISIRSRALRVVRG